MADQTLKFIIDAQDKASQVLNDVSGKLDTLKNKIEPAADASKKFAIAIGGAGLALGAFGLSAIKSAASMEQTQIAFETMLGSGEKAKQLYDDLGKFAAKTPFT